MKIIQNKMKNELYVTAQDLEKVNYAQRYLKR